MTHILSGDSTKIGPCVLSDCVYKPSTQRRRVRVGGPGLEHQWDRDRGCGAPMRKRKQGNNNDKYRPAPQNSSRAIFPYTLWGSFEKSNFNYFVNNGRSFSIDFSKDARFRDPIVSFEFGTRCSHHYYETGVGHTVFRYKMVEKCDECSVHFQNHKQIIIDKVENFLSRQVFADMTLVCGGGKKIKVHRAVLAACSPYFEEILLDIEDQNYPVFILNDIPEGIMTLLLKFIYRGKTNIPRNLKQLFLKIAKQLQIRGLGHEAVITSQVGTVMLVKVLKKYELRIIYKYCSKVSSSVGHIPQIRKSADEYSALLTNRQNSEDIASSATSSAGLISVVRGQHQEQIRKLPLKIITDTGEKVINPFTIKQLRVNETESDSSSSSSEDLFKPSSSKPANEKVAVSSKVPNTIDSDSDIELIEDDPAITVLNNTSNPANEKVAVSSKVPNTIDSDSDIELIEDDPAITVLNNTSNTTQWFTCVEYESDDSDVVPSLPKRGKSPNKLVFTLCMPGLRGGARGAGAPGPAVQWGPAGVLLLQNVRWTLGPMLNNNAEGRPVLTLICIVRDVLEELEFDDVIQEFVKLKLRKQYFDLRPLKTLIAPGPMKA
ncbi:hypothetical protein NQ317_013726 [Molorchus minor]|uniref:BTB domain-containing protein n=1 Tax=Molorchus minor TaxID=1323400 RepID=A0ABQ9JPY2_9CUCU|nr:hypothetical protein NQ317_013726 [Molorchus minor]